MSRANDLLKELIRDVKNPNLANGEVAVRIALAAEAHFTKEEKSVPKQEAKAEIPAAPSGGADSDKPVPTKYRSAISGTPGAAAKARVPT